MSDYSELKQLAQRVIDLEEAEGDAPIGEAWDEFEAVATPSVVLSLIAEIERLCTEAANAIQTSQHFIDGGAEITATIDHLKAENAGLKTGYEAYEQVVQGLRAENEVARMRIKELDLLFGRYILAMRAAVIEENAEKGMEWIYSSLAGPGELPPEDETDAQGYFDREIVAVDDGMQEVMAFHEGRRSAMSKEAQS